MPLWRWGARRARKPIVDEHSTAIQQVERSPEEWRRWWKERGERELTCILMTAWDPVGAGDAPEAWDEYDGYAPAIASRLRDAPGPEAAAESVAEYVQHVERDFMGFEPTKDRRRSNQCLAAALVAWHEWSSTRGGRPLDES